jgi:hypothetical protein
VSDGPAKDNRLVHLERIITEGAVRPVQGVARISCCQAEGPPSPSPTSGLYREAQLEGLSAGGTIRL